MFVWVKSPCQIADNVIHFQQWNVYNWKNRIHFCTDPRSSSDHPPLGNILIIFLRNQIQRMKSLNLKIIIFNFVDPRIFFVRLFTFSSARSV